MGRTNSAEEDDGGRRGIYASLFSLESHTHKWLNYYKWGQPILEYFKGMFLPFFYIFTSTLWMSNLTRNERYFAIKITSEIDNQFAAQKQGPGSWKALYATMKSNYSKFKIKLFLF